MKSIRNGKHVDKSQRLVFPPAFITITIQSNIYNTMLMGPIMYVFVLYMTIAKRMGKGNYHNIITFLYIIREVYNFNLKYTEKLKSYIVIPRVTIKKIQIVLAQKPIWKLKRNSKNTQLT